MKLSIAVPIIAALVHRAWSRKSLTPFGIVVAALTAIAHAVNPWSLPLFLLLVFYLGGTKATKVKHDIKAQLTLSATGSHGGEGARTHIQVLANSIVATVLSLVHAWVIRNNKADGLTAECFSNGRHAADLLVVGIVANYAAVAADTFSSELGILSKSKPRLITSPTLRVVPPGTNGGVTGTGILAGLLGAFTIAVTSAILLPLCGSFKSTVQDRIIWILATTFWGGLGSILDSVLGGLFQASVVDKRSGKIVEGTGGQKVLLHPSSTKPGNAAETLHSTAGTTGAQLRNTETAANTAALKGTRATGTSTGTENGEKIHHESRRIESGHDILDNNAVNVLMALIMSVGAMVAASYVWDLSVWDAFA
ncbi:hypothetical protein AN7615.2 [Aspergillus nidulans FGSC A4]|uniref:DUF92 domain protein (AFU_orthologue AFUA_2G15640) n=1 Tax=Emericella nidulans (strain FGSC A4 / ATCC 38163 / CBS 112.46 / NRRL 194 / M139) TaxID=227321 RepID=Q5AVR5_EMENI|nr:hypothetical protein [Aspergillus nidulans FGSC A4]EAA61801.1 hypothetical protein AN7615.2 [Aspergillus nidulans FGSC A4]CBF79747.1 TPA: DUF92 domain protein (AFU_orthologue; AFUA_2G15640) [Aspergillus nidulans FGSC A4]|eukprot:XP_680884.1 hypothetical protein AN7615.2 [Aspergillus nidulans FGSC A4]